MGGEWGRDEEDGERTGRETGGGRRGQIGRIEDPCN